MSSILKVDTIQNTGGTTGLSIDSSGRVTQPSMPAWRIGVSSNYDITNGQNSYNVANFSLTSDTTRRFFTQGGITVSSGVVTVPVSGIYNVGSTVRMDNISTGYALITMGINGSFDASRGSYNLKGNSGFSSNYHTWTENTIFKLDASDTVRVYIYISNDSSVVVSSLSYFSGFLIG